MVKSLLLVVSCCILAAAASATPADDDIEILKRAEAEGSRINGGWFYLPQLSLKRGNSLAFATRPNGFLFPTMNGAPGKRDNTLVAMRPNSFLFPSKLGKRGYRNPNGFNFPLIQQGKRSVEMPLYDIYDNDRDVLEEEKRAGDDQDMDEFFGGRGKREAAKQRRTAQDYMIKMNPNVFTSSRG